MNGNVLVKRPHLIPAAIAALLLFGALGHWPYGYYQLLRFVVCGISIYIAFMAYKWQELYAMSLFGLIAVLFNPFIPIHLPREIWWPIDITSALLFAAVAASKGRKRHSTDNDSYGSGKSSQQLIDWGTVTFLLIGLTLGALGTYFICFNLLGKEKSEASGISIPVSILTGLLFVFVYLSLMTRKEEKEQRDNYSSSIK